MVLAITADLFTGEVELAAIAHCVSIVVAFVRVRQFTRVACCVSLCDCAFVVAATAVVFISPPAIGLVTKDTLGCWNVA